MHPALEVGEVALALGDEVRDAVHVAQHARRRQEARQRRRLGDQGRGANHEDSEDGEDGGDRGEEASGHEILLACERSCAAYTPTRPAVTLARPGGTREVMGVLGLGLATAGMAEGTGGAVPPRLLARARGGRQSEATRVADTPTDGELMIRVQGGDLAALGPLFERHHLRLFNYFLRLTGDRQGAEDLVQEVFVRMLKYRGSYRERGEFVAWMFTLARNTSADWLGKRSREAPAPEAPPERPSDEPLVQERLEREESIVRLRECLLALPVDKRELLLLARSGRLSYDEIAGVLGVSVGAVKVRVHRALKLLRSIYLDDAATEERRRHHEM